jgi:hypothetical protein
MGRTLAKITEMTARVIAVLPVKRAMRCSKSFCS